MYSKTIRTTANITRTKHNINEKKKKNVPISQNNNKINHRIIHSKPHTSPHSFGTPSVAQHYIAFAYIEIHCSLLLALFQIVFRFNLLNFWFVEHFSIILLYVVGDKV